MLGLFSISNMEHRRTKSKLLARRAVVHLETKAKSS